MRFIADHTPENYAHGRVLTDEVIAEFLQNPAIQLTNGEADGLEMISYPTLSCLVPSLSLE